MDKWSLSRTVSFVLAVSAVLWMAMAALTVAFHLAPWSTGVSFGLIAAAVWLEMRRVQRGG